MQFRIETEARNIVLGVLRRDGLQNAYGNQVFGFGQGSAQAHRPFEFAIVVFRLPGLGTRLRRGKGQRRIVDHSRRGEPIFQCCRINKRLETGAGLAQGLGHMIELVTVEIEPADQGADRPRTRIRRNQRGLHLGQLCNLPAAFFILGDAYDRAAADTLGRRHILAEQLRCKLQPIFANGDAFAAGPVNAHLLRAGFQHNGRINLVTVGRILKRVLQFVIGQFTGQLNVGLGTAITMTTVVIENPLAQGIVGGALMFRQQGRIDLEAMGISILAVAFKHLRPHHLGEIVGPHMEFIDRLPHHHGFFVGIGQLLWREHSEFAHPAQYILLAQFGARRIGNWIEP